MYAAQPIIRTQYANGVEECSSIGFINVTTSSFNHSEIGDSINDIEMFKKCKIKVAMKNASDELKSVSSKITDKTNDEDGVANFLKENMNIFKNIE